MKFQNVGLVLDESSGKQGSVTDSLTEEKPAADTANGNAGWPVPFELQTNNV